MDKFISCDWGTSNLRLRLIEVNDLKIIAEESNDRGIAATYNLWKQQRGNDLPRRDFYLSILKNHLSSLRKKSNISLENIPVIISGMASSSIGIIELPYKKLPFDLDGSNLEVRTLDYKDSSNKFMIISGARTDDDVMRGEETKIIGCSLILNDIEEEQTVILPGTHPKHVGIKKNKAAGLRTYMTGEFFQLLSMQSVLSNSLQNEGDFNDPANREKFSNGVVAGSRDNLLHAAFTVRTNELLKNISKQENYYYLSGLLIGTELRDLKPGIPISIVGGRTLTPYYEASCEILGIPIKERIDADIALIEGHKIILSIFLSKNKKC